MRADRTATRQRQTSTLAVMKSAPDLHEQIRRPAYDPYEERGEKMGTTLTIGSARSQR